jgi:dTDP-4-dehydrorhamnose 3,5-epimerase
MELGKKDKQTVEPDGGRPARFIDGVVVRKAVTQEDERGDLTEIFDPRWGIMEGPIVYIYQTTIRPGRVKGWVYHKAQSDLLFVSAGFLKIVLHDLRPDSPTAGQFDEIFLSERNRGLVQIPPMVLHAVENVGDKDAAFINMPTAPYNHKNPDKYRISITSGEILYSFDKGRGW